MPHYTVLDRTRQGITYGRLLVSPTLTLPEHPVGTSLSIPPLLIATLKMDRSFSVRLAVMRVGRVPSQGLLTRLGMAPAPSVGASPRQPLWFRYLARIPTLALPLKLVTVAVTIPRRGLLTPYTD